MMRTITSRPILRATAVLGLFAALFGGWAQAAEKSDSKVKAEVKADKPDASGKQTVSVTLNIDKAWHIYANPVGGDPFLEPGATKLSFLAGTAKIEDAKVEYPKGKRVTVKGDSYNVYEDTVTIKATVQRPKDGPVKLKIKVQACNDSNCLLPGEILVDLP
jgi:DsbC/DsbD-like thiol-disulfide interchange protein